MNTENEKNETSSLSEILNSIKLENTTKSNIVNFDFDNVNNVDFDNVNNVDFDNVNNVYFNNVNNVDEQIQSENINNTNDLVNITQDENTEITREFSQKIYQNNDISQQVQLLSNEIDRRIGNYLLDELEKKKQYIDELEEAIKFQEKEITELKQKLEVVNKLELLGKIKSNMDTKLLHTYTNNDIQSEISEYEREIETETETETNSKLNKVVQVKKSTQSTQLQKVNIVKDEEQTQYPRNYPDLVLRRDTVQKVKSVSKEEEEPRYNGIIMLDRPKKKEENTIKITLDYETETSNSTDKISDVIKQRRRNARF
jgi:hypothetical protein